MQAADEGSGCAAIAGAECRAGGHAAPGAAVGSPDFVRQPLASATQRAEPGHGFPELGADSTEQRRVPGRGGAISS